MGWSQRGNGHTFDSLNGYCALIGLKTGKVLDYSTRNRKCRTCDSQAKTGRTVEHDCRLNFKGTAKAMEADGAVELVTRSSILKDANVQVGVFIADNDCCSISSIQDASNFKILKQSDMNHSVKGVSKLLYLVHGNKSQDPERELTPSIIIHIKRCFSFAVHQNKGDVAKIKAAIVNVPFHLFDHHENCGTWCHGEENKENATSIRLKSLVLFEVLKGKFLELSETAQNYVSAASSQPNESLNNSMCSKNPKRLSYSTSQSSDYRFAATVAQKNLGTSYLQMTLDKLEMSWSQNLNKYTVSSTKTFLQRKDRASQPAFKRNRMKCAAKRSQIKNQKELREGVMYQSNMNLLPNSLPDENTVDDSVVEALDPTTRVLETDQALVVFFDLETAGLSPTHEILQISMKAGCKVYNSFITPTQTISHLTTKANGLSSVLKKLFQNGVEVKTLPCRVVLGQLLEFLKGLNKKSILVAHNCQFDSTRLVMCLKRFNLLEESQNYVLGFVDTLALFRKKFPKRESGHKLTTLASELMSLPCHGAHDALFDVGLLEKLTIKYINIDDLVNNQKTVMQVELDLGMKDHLFAYTPLDMTEAMKRRLIEHEMTHEKLIEIFKSRGEDETVRLLRKEVNGKPQLIKTKKHLQIILDYLKKLP
ncbi:hypothetical protein QAD02_020487 [Eretmocerus hayati]|uniref:Uncharacterized protein n=1 Tax=Eretmocerus hayati TaxID=131215 RepID=A0ACC2PQ08_9HYME|nr:hypothetical protein QAD02_020487 [Eretmocerus hayati]